MTVFRGCCTYPHGGTITAGLFLASVLGLVATILAASSCQFVVVSFTSDLGGFLDLFVNSGAGAELLDYQAGAGLFEWLESDNRQNWSEGQCSGYTERQLEIIADPTFEAARFLAVVAVLMGFLVTVWTFSMSCFSLGRRQVWILCTLEILLSIILALSFLVLKSALCHDVGENTTCEIDQGGMIAVGAILMWFLAFLITVVFVRTTERNTGMRIRWNSRKESRRRVEQYSRQNSINVPKRTLTDDTHTFSDDPAILTSVTSAGEEGEMEIYLKYREELDTTEDMVEELDTKEYIVELDTTKYMVGELDTTEDMVGELDTTEDVVEELDTKEYIVEELDTKEHMVEV